MPISFQNFQLILAAGMTAGLLILTMPLVLLAARARLPRLSVILVLVPLLNVVWLSLVARSMTASVHQREET
jgi:hypothetical protein